MAYEIIYECKSINNKNVREGELNILRSYPEKLYFEFGENEINIKKRFYNDLETMKTDYEAILAIKEAEKVIIETSEIASIDSTEIKVNESVDAIDVKKVEEENEERPVKTNRRKKRF